MIIAYLFSIAFRLSCSKWLENRFLQFWKCHSAATLVETLGLSWLQDYLIYCRRRCDNMRQIFSSTLPPSFWPLTQAVKVQHWTQQWSKQGSEYLQAPGDWCLGTGRNSQASCWCESASHSQFSCWLALLNQWQGVLYAVQEKRWQHSWWCVQKDKCLGKFICLTVS